MANLMEEAFLQYIWKHFLFNNSNLVSDSGEQVEILNPGMQSFDSGPDFLNAKIRIGQTIWAGNVEVHNDTASWNKHNHQHNKAYNNVILHVVNKVNSIVYTESGQRVPALELKYNPVYLDFYRKLMASQKTIACQDRISNIDKSYLELWFESLLIERIEQKSGLIDDILKRTSNNWEEAFYIYLARTFGFKLNALPFELLAFSLPFKILQKHSSDLFQIEALLFGQAGFLEKEEGDAHCQKLRAEYFYLKKLYKLKAIELEIWKFLRLRPLNFPTIRIAQFAVLIHNSNKLLSRLLECKSIKDYVKLFNGGVSRYWEDHYNFGKLSSNQKKTLGLQSINNILLNAVLPFLFVYSKKKDNQQAQQNALDLFFNIPAEKNKIVKEWTIAGIQPKNAAHTQALIQLRNMYCLKKKCLNCQIGHSVINCKTS